MGRTSGNFIDPETGKPDDRAWLDDQILHVVTSKSICESARFPNGPPPRTAREIYETVAPISHRSWPERKSWERKPRKIKRAMVEGSLRRLIANGKIRLFMELQQDHKSMHGTVRRNIKRDSHLFGKNHDGKMRHYVPSNVLEALVEALSEGD